MDFLFEWELPWIDCYFLDSRPFLKWMGGPTGRLMGGPTGGLVSGPTGGLMDVDPQSRLGGCRCDGNYQKRKFLMAYVSIFLEAELPKKEILHNEIVRIYYQKRKHSVFATGKKYQKRKFLMVYVSVGKYFQKKKF